MVSLVSMAHKMVLHTAQVLEVKSYTKNLHATYMRYNLMSFVHSRENVKLKCDFIGLLWFERLTCEMQNEKGETSGQRRERRWQSYSQQDINHHRKAKFNYLLIRLTQICWLSSLAPTVNVVLANIYGFPTITVMTHSALYYHHMTDSICTIWWSVSPPTESHAVFKNKTPDFSLCTPCYIMSIMKIKFKWICEKSKLSE